MSFQDKTAPIVDILVNAAGWHHLLLACVDFMSLTQRSAYFGGLIAKGHLHEYHEYPQGTTSGIRALIIVSARQPTNFVFVELKIIKYQLFKAREKAIGIASAKP